jgi:4-amino-4-deoxy-L-arabinose transferase-like glycosyltransferase
MRAHARARTHVTATASGLPGGARARARFARASRSGHGAPFSCPFALYFFNFLITAAFCPWLAARATAARFRSARFGWRRHGRVRAARGGSVSPPGPAMRTRQEGT